MKMKKRFLSILLSLVMVLGLMPGMSMTAYADGSYPQTYLIQATCTSSNFYRTGTIVANTTLPYTFTGAQLWFSVNAGYGCDHIIKKSGTNIEINGTNIKVTGDGTSSVDNYATSTGSLPFDIKVTKNITTVVDGYTGGYDSNEHGISVDVKVPSTGYTIKYGTQNGTYNLTESPKYKTAGNYTVYYQVTADGYNTKTGSAVVSISKLDPVTPTNLTATYGQTLANVTLPAGWTWVDSTQSVGNVVSPAATFKANFAGNDNYNAASNVDVTVTVGKADPTAPTGLTATYGQTLADVALPTGWTWADSTQSVGSVVSPAATFKANFAGNGNYNAASNVDVTVTVGKANAVAATVTANSRTYDGTEKPLVTVTGEATGATMQYALGTANEATEPYITSIPSKTEAGTYYVWYKAVAKNDNYQDSTPICVEVTINAAQADGSSTAKPLPYDGNSQALVNPGEVIGGKMFYALGSDNVTAPVDGWSETVPTATEPGTYYVWYKVEGDENHNDVAPTCVVVTIEKPYNPAEYSDFTLLATLKTSGKKALKLSWTVVEGAEGYDIFFGSSSASAAPYLTSVNGNEYTVNKLKNGRGYRANVQAWRTVNGNKVYIGQPSPDAFTITGGKTKKFTNPKKISVNKKKRNVTLAAGKTAKIKAKVTKVASGKRFLKQVAKIRYFSSDRRVATVDAKGNITAVGAGACKVFAVAANGLRVGVNVTVK